MNTGKIKQIMGPVIDVEFDELLSLADERAQAPSFAELTARVDQALVDLDAVLEQRAGQGPAQDVQVPAGCQALTRAGKPCKNRALAGSRFCRVHQEPKN